MAGDVGCVGGYVQADGSLGESAVYLTPDEWGTITVSDAGIIPDRSYTVRVAQGSPEEAMLSDAAEAKTWKWGDVANDLGEPVGDGIVGLADIFCAMDGFSTPSACTSMDQKPCLQVDGTNDVDDLLVVLDAFGGETYPVSCAAAYPPCYAPAAPPPLPALKHNPYYFTGRRLDHDLKNASGETTLALYHYRARRYDPIHGGFLQRDPAEYVDGASLYEYVGSAPAMYADPTGTQVDPQSITLLDRVLQGIRLEIHFEQGAVHAHIARRTAREAYYVWREGKFVLQSGSTANNVIKGWLGNQHSRGIIRAAISKGKQLVGIAEQAGVAGGRLIPGVGRIPPTARPGMASVATLGWMIIIEG